MKNLYLKIFILLTAFIFQLYLPTKLTAQCTCALGLPATPITQSVTIAPTASSNLAFTFNKFDPSIGTLSCLTFTSNISGISVSGARNTNKGNYHVGATEYVDSTDYLFSLSLLSKISGPSGSGISISKPFNTVYGYDKLKDVDTIGNIAGDTISYGPTNFITAPTNTVSISGPSAVYIGTGTFDFNYTVNGGMITLDGGANYKQSVTSIIGGKIDLTYYWCPAALLANGLQNFSAHKKDNNVFLKWDAQNATGIDQYEVEYSLDGISYASVATVAANHSAMASTYDYTYTLNGNSNGYVYFRIKQTNVENKSGFSAVQKVQLNDKAGFGASVHPNPAITGLSVTFDRPLNGEYSVDLVNMSGQAIISKKVKMSGSSIIPVNWSSKPASGVYFTRVTNTSTMEQQIVRVVVQ